MKKILLFVNPLLHRAGSRRKDIAGAVHVFRTAGATVHIVETGKDRDAGPRVRQAIADGYDTIVVCGGDGTVFDVIQGMSGSSVPLGIVPMGTGNVLAQNLKIPTHSAGAAQLLLRAHPLRVPLGKITCCSAAGQQTWLFAMSAGMGMHAALMAEAKRAGKDVTGKVAYFVAGGRLLFNHPVQAFEIAATTTSGAVHTRRVSEALALRVAELNLWRPGGGLNLGFLRLASVAGCSRVQLLRATVDALFFSGGARDGVRAETAAAQYEDVVRVVCRPIEGHTYRPAMAVQADGEVIGAACAEIEMAGSDVIMLAAGPAGLAGPHGAHPGFHPG
jgi:diacylglycerol kinase (ATP)